MTTSPTVPTARHPNTSVHPTRRWEKGRVADSRYLFENIVHLVLP